MATSSSRGRVLLTLLGDLFINQMNLLDRAVKLVAELDEPLDQNFVRKHALEQAEESRALSMDDYRSTLSTGMRSHTELETFISKILRNGSCGQKRQFSEHFRAHKMRRFVPNS